MSDESQTSSPPKLGGILGQKPVEAAQQPETSIESEAKEPAEVEKIYTCHPIKNLKFGSEFVFENSRMVLSDPARIAKFDKMLSAMKPAQRHRIKTLDLELAHKMARDRVPAARRGFDSGKNPDAERLARENPKVGTQDMGRKSNEGN